MRTLLLLALALAPLAPAAAAEVTFDPDEFTVCVPHRVWEICVSRDGTWYCYTVSTGRPPGIHDCFQFIGP